MTGGKPPIITPDFILEYITRGHAYSKHALGNDDIKYYNKQNAFKHVPKVDNLGPNLQINTPSDLYDYAKTMINRPDTVAWMNTSTTRSNNPDYILTIYNKKDNVMIRINPFDAERDFGTIYRYADITRSEATKEIKAALKAEKQSGNPLYFDNQKDPEAVKNTLQNYADNINNNPQKYRLAHEALQRPPGYMHKPRKENILHTTKDLSNDYIITKDKMLQFNDLETSLKNSAGFIATTDSKLRPDQMFFLDTEKNRVIEIHNSNKKINIYDFNNLPPEHRNNAARYIYNEHLSSTPENTQIIDVENGGYDALNNKYREIRKIDKTPVIGGDLETFGRLAIAPNGINYNYTTQHKFDNIEQMMRHATGLTKDELHLFEHLPNDLSHIKSTPVRKAAEDIGAAKGLIEESTPDRMKQAIKTFREEYNKQPLPIQKELLKIAEEAADVTPQTANRLTNTFAKLASKLKPARLALNTVKTFGIGFTITGAGMLITHQANAALLDTSESLLKQGKITPQAYTDYHHLMKNEIMPLMDLQAADPSNLALATMAITEAIAYNKFQHFSNKHLLPQNIHDELCPAIISGGTISEKMVKESFKILPDKTLPPSHPLFDLVNARLHVEDTKEQWMKDWAIAETPVTWGFWPLMLTPYEEKMNTAIMIKSQENVDKATEEFKTKLTETLHDPVKSKELIKLLPQNELITITEKTLAFNITDGTHPLLKEHEKNMQALATAQTSSIYDSLFHDPDSMYPSRSMTNLLSIKRNYEESSTKLKENPEIVKSYVQNLFLQHEETEIEKTKMPAPYQIRSPDNAPALVLH